VSKIKTRFCHREIFAGQSFPRKTRVLIRKKPEAGFKQACQPGLAKAYCVEFVFKE
jgi:hypothetical protein